MLFIHPLFLIFTAGLFCILFLLYFFRALSLKIELKQSLKLNSNQKNDIWDSKEDLEIVSVIEESHDIKSFVLRRKNGKNIPLFHPGQFVSFQVGNSLKDIRSYSISSSPLHPYQFQVSVKKINNGLGSTFFHQLKTGDSVVAYPPSGHFSDINLSADVQRIYVAGGVGITPFLSMILYNLESHSNLPMALFYGARTKADLVFHEYLLFLSNRFKNFKYFPNISTQDPSWSDSPRFIDLSYIQQKIAYNENSHFYFCGPSQMTDSLIQALQNAQFNTSHIHNEKFISPTAIDLSKLSEMNCDIEVNGKTYLYQGKQSLLEFMEQNSIPVAYACRSGVCGACKCKVKGRSLQLSDSGLTEQEKIWGFALTCVSYPLENLKIDTSEN